MHTHTHTVKTNRGADSIPDPLHSRAIRTARAREYKYRYFFFARGNFFAKSRQGDRRAKNKQRTGPNSSLSANKVRWLYLYTTAAVRTKKKRKSSARRLVVQLSDAAETLDANGVRGRETRREKSAEFTVKARLVAWLILYCGSGVGGTAVVLAKVKRGIAAAVDLVVGGSVGREREALMKARAFWYPGAERRPHVRYVYHLGLGRG